MPSYDYLMLRSARRARLEARTALLQRSFRRASEVPSELCKSIQRASRLSEVVRADNAAAPAITGGRSSRRLRRAIIGGQTRSLA